MPPAALLHGSGLPVDPILLLRQGEELHAAAGQQIGQHVPTLVRHGDQRIRKHPGKGQQHEHHEANAEGDRFSDHRDVLLNPRHMPPQPSVTAK
jgi:hypothetical protein